MECTNYYVTGSKVPAGPLRDLEIEVEVKGSEEVKKVKNEEIKLTHRLPRNFVSENFKVPSALRC